MKTFFNIQSATLIFAVLLITAATPQTVGAQRFNHSSPQPARAPQPARQAAPQPARQEAPQQARPTINGGSRNTGTHSYNQNRNTAPVHEEVKTPVDVHAKVAVHDDVSVYHTGAYHGLRPYVYHPFHPYYWGPRWHPAGYFINTLAYNAFRFSLANQWYYYDDGCYYEPYNGGYTVVAPPVGAVVNYLPDGYETVQVGDYTYYYYGGAFYISTGAQTYQVVQAPVGAIVSQLPVGAVEQNVNGQIFMVYDNTYFQPISQDGQDAYEVVPGN